MKGPYRAEHGAILHESSPGFLFTVQPATAADSVADALNTAAAFDALPPPGYVTSGPHLSGFRVCMGYGERSQADAAHTLLAQRGRATASMTRDDIDGMLP